MKRKEVQQDAQRAAVLDDTTKQYERLSEQYATTEAGKILTNCCHGVAVASGWWNDPATGKPLDRNVPEMLCLIHSEISEGMEGYRKNLMDDKLPHRPMLEVELADAVIRIADLAGVMGLDLAGAVIDGQGDLFGEAP